MPVIDIRGADDRFATRTGWLDSRHSFSFGQHYDPTDTHFGLLLVNNDDVVAPGTGFDTHPHRDMEIVTWVLQGSLVHQDSTGHNGLIYPGLAQRMSAGRGILHSEKNDAPGGIEPVHFVQMWVLPDQDALEPGYEQLEIDPERLAGGWATVASGRGGDSDTASIRIRQRDAALHAARLQPGEAVWLPSAPYVHLYVAAGAVELEGAAGSGVGPLGTGRRSTGRLGTGDAARVVGADGQRVVALEAAELLAWEMHSSAAA